MVLNVVCCETAKCPELGAKRTSRGHRADIANVSRLTDAVEKRLENVAEQ